jgi:hypothetical protein
VTFSARIESFARSWAAHFSSAFEDFLEGVSNVVAPGRIWGGSGPARGLPGVASAAPRDCDRLMGRCRGALPLSGVGTEFQNSEAG